MPISKYFPKLFIRQRSRVRVNEIDSAAFMLVGDETRSKKDVVGFINALLSNCRKEGHLYTVIYLDFDSSPRINPGLPRLVVTDGMSYIWDHDKKEERILKELRKSLSPYCRKDPGYKRPTYIVKFPGQEESGFEVESRWTESSSDPRYLECRQFTVTVRKNKMVTRSEGVSAFISTVLAQSPNLIACLNMVSGEKMTLECIDTDLSDYEITVSPPTSDDSNIFILDFIKSRYKHERPIKLGSNLDLPDILKLISGY